MPKSVNGTPAEREAFMEQTFKDFYSNPANKGKNLSVGKANEQFKAKFGSMLRNKRAYEIRDQVMVTMGLKAPPANPPPPAVTQAVAPTAVESTPAPVVPVPAAQPESQPSQQ